MTIKFYLVKDAYGCFSNFAPYPFTLDGRHWPTSEHYFQAQKFVGFDDAHAAAIQVAKSPMIAARLGRSREHPLRPDWESVKDEVMREAVLAKFTTHADIRAMLLGTGDAELIEATTKDYYWGCGAKRTGKNRLGQVLEEVREMLRKSAST